MTTNDLFHRISVDAKAFEDGLATLRRAFEDLRVRTDIWVRELRRLGRRSHGNRHRGTVAWALRYAPARRDLPLGQRTAAKRRALAARKESIS